MTPNRLVLTPRAISDIDRRARVLKAERGAAFAVAWVEALFDWLTRLAEGGAQIGTTRPRHPGFRSFGYRRQATILAEFAGGELRVVRIYFAGQDWTAPA